MPASYPTTIKTFTAKTDNVDTVYAADVNSGYDEITAIETEVGTSPKAAALEAPAATAAAVVNLLGQIKQAIKGIQGTTNWYDAVPATLQNLLDRFNVTTGHDHDGTDSKSLATVSNIDIWFYQTIGV